jgi:hypothetical protein
MIGSNHPYGTVPVRPSAYSAFRPISSGAVLPTGFICLACLGCVFLPIVVMMPVTIMLSDSSRETPYLSEMFVYFGWTFGLAALLLALPLALYANRREINGWLSSTATGAAIGALSSVFFLMGVTAEFVIGTTALGATYGLSFWVLAHSLYALALRKAARR